MKIMKHIIRLLIAVFVLSAALPVTSCKSAKLRDADEAFDRGEYYDAAEIYRKVYNRLKKREDRWQRGEVAYMMGLCHLKLNQGFARFGGFPERYPL